MGLLTLIHLQFLSKSKEIYGKVPSLHEKLHAYWPRYIIPINPSTYIKHMPSNPLAVSCYYFRCLTCNYFSCLTCNYFRCLKCNYFRCWRQWHICWWYWRRPFSVLWPWGNSFSDLQLHYKFCHIWLLFLGWNWRNMEYCGLSGESYSSKWLLWVCHFR